MIVATILKNYIDAERSKLKVFTARFEKHPCDALEGSASAFEAAARLEVCEKVLAALKGGKTTARKLREYALEQVLNRAGRTHHSTSPTVNLMEDHRRAAWAMLVDPLSGALSEIVLNEAQEVTA